MKLRLYIVLIMSAVLNLSLSAIDTHVDIKKYIIEYYNDQRYDELIKIGGEYLRNKSELLSDEDIIVLYHVFKSQAIVNDIRGAEKLFHVLEFRQSSSNFTNYLKYYKATLFIILNKNEGVAIFEELLDPNIKASMPDSMLSKIYHNLAICYNRNSNTSKAFYYTQKAFDLDKILVSKLNNYESFNLSAAGYLNILSSIYKQYEEALKVYRELFSYPFNKEINADNEYLFMSYFNICMDLNLQDEMHDVLRELELFYLGNRPYFDIDLAVLYKDIAKYSFSQNKYNESITYYEKSLSISVPDVHYRNFRASSAMGLARIYQRLDKKSLASTYVKESIVEIKKKKDNKLDEFYAASAQVFAMLNYQNVAKKYLDSALHVSLKNNIETKNIGYENMMAWANLKLNQYEESIIHFHNLLELYSDDRNYAKYDYWDTANDLSLPYLKMKDYSKAADILVDIYNDMKGKYTEELLIKKGSNLSRLYRRININLAKAIYGIYLQTGETKELNKSFHHLKEADTSIDAMRSQLSFDSDQMAASASYAEYVDIAVQVTSDLYKATNDKSYLRKSFEYAQKGKSYSLLLGLNDKQWKISAGIPDSIISNENHIKGRLSFYQNEADQLRLQKEYDEEILSHLTGRVDYYMNQLDSINSYVAEVYPRYFQLKYAPQYDSVEDIQSRLGENQMLIDYHLSEDKIIQFVISPNSFKQYENELDSLFVSDLEYTLQEISTPFIAAGNALDQIRQFAKSSHHLYSKLLGNIEDEIQGKDLIIIPHGELAYLPFETLLTKDVSDRKPDFRKYPWLLNNFNVAYEYNSSLLPSFSEKQVEFDKVLSFAPSYYGSEFHSDSVLINIREAINDYLVPLFAAKEEINNIAKVFDSELFVDNAASKSNFLENVDENNVLHLAMHSLNDEVQPLNSQLVFSAENDSTSALKAFEIYNYNIKSPMVVLSSCSTGRGKKKTGEGLMSLARAFKFAGVQTQIMTLWAVHDQSGATLSTLFYDYLKEKNFKDNALRKAKQDYIASSDLIHAHPYYWANYVITGNTSPIVQSQKSYYWYALAGILILSFLIFALKRKR